MLVGQPPPAPQLSASTTISSATARWCASSACEGERIQADGDPAGPGAGVHAQREDGSEFTRADLEGKTTVLVFYPFAFSPVCTDQLELYEEVLGDELAKRGATMYGVSCDATLVADGVSGRSSA